MSAETAAQLMREIETALSGCIVALELGDAVDRDAALKFARQVLGRVRVLLGLDPRTPYVGWSNETLAKLPEAKVGQAFGDCPRCGGDHVLEGKEGDPVLFYQCKGESFVGAVGGRFIAFTRADVKGEL